MKTTNQVPTCGHTKLQQNYAKRKITRAPNLPKQRDLLDYNLYKKGPFSAGPE